MLIILKKRRNYRLQSHAIPYHQCTPVEPSNSKSSEGILFLAEIFLSTGFRQYANKGENKTAPL